MTTELILAIITILAGTMILAFPGLLRFLVGGYLVLVGIVGLILAIL